MIDMAKASEFMQTHARAIDRRRFEYLFGNGSAGDAVTALAGYANADGGFGWALEPDLRSESSQPIAALHAFEVFEEIAPQRSELAAKLCDWLESVSLADGGLPFALPGSEGAGSAPIWAAADQSKSSLLITAALCAVAHRVAQHDPAVSAHRWLHQASGFCKAEIAALERPQGAIQFRFVLQLLDAVHDKSADAVGELERLGPLVPKSGSMPVQGGAEDERIRPVDFSPQPDRPLRAFFAPEVIGADLDSLAAEQLDDGGWDVDWKSFSPAAPLEWRGWKTVHALKILGANGRLT